jgi:predicted phosphoadenosine phosphosulfate sulfurtransferase
MPKRSLEMDVLTAARERAAWTFDNFAKMYVSFSAGKDSGVMLHIVMEEAKRRGRRVGVLFIDWECQMSLTIDHAREMFELYRDNIDPYWIALPMRTWNGCSQIEPEWIAWDSNKRDLWVREPEAMSITDPARLPFYYDTMPFEEFIDQFGKWYAAGDPCACFVGIRTQESLNRFRSIARVKPMYDGKPWTTNVDEQLWNVYPIYDWQTEDVWTYFAKERKPHNALYDRMYQAGLTIHQMRICEPFGDTQRQGLWLYQVIEPERWAKMVCRVHGANTGALYGNEKGAVLGNHSIALPEGHTYESFARHILHTMPPPTANHYKNKLAVYLHWWGKRGYEDGIPDSADKKLEANGRVPSWRKICKTFLRNDYWCRGLGFSPTKTMAYAHYNELMKRRRKDWNIFPESAP